MSKILDIVKIQKDINKKHKSFIDALGNVTSKINADNDLYLTRMRSKISRILDCFIDSKIIDKVSPCDDNYVGFHLEKKGFLKSVYIWTDGTSVILKDSNLLIKHGLDDAEVEKIEIENIDTYDWEKFAIILVDYIHKVIYDRRLAIEMSLFYR